MNNYNVGGVIKTAVTCTPEPNGKVVMNLVVESQDTFTDRARKTHTKKNSHNVELWDKSAKMVASNYSKGSYIVVIGRAETVIKDGVEITKLIVSSVENIARRE
jgi:single-stranded DNA-binding protein